VMLSIILEIDIIKMRDIQKTGSGR
jgi:hypothetical protein